MNQRLRSAPFLCAAMLLTAALVALMAVATSAQIESPSRISDALQARLSRGERVRVVVELRSEAAGKEATDEHTAMTIARVQDRFLGRTRHFGEGKRLKNFPVVALEVDGGALAELMASPDVLSVRVDELRRPSLAESVPLIQAPTAWSLGATGAGWTVAVIDSGVDKAHPYLSGKVVSEACYSSSGGSASSVCPGGINSTAPGSGVNCSPGIAGCDHGTHIAGIAAGNGASFPGVAKEASVIAIQVYSRIDDPAFCSPDPSPCVGAFDSDILAGMDRVYALRNQYNIAAALLSLGSGAYAGSCDADVPIYKSSIDALRAEGIASVVSSGNAGLISQMTAPACVTTAISVGASDKNDQLAGYTNRSPLLKFLAPGSSIYSPSPGGSFSFFSGTSMAAAHVAGAWALVMDRNPSATVTQVQNAFLATAAAIPDPPNGTTRPRINVGAAVQSVTTGPVTVALLNASPALPQPTGVPITFSARAFGGPGELEYKFWLFNQQSGTWSVLRDYATARSVVWTPTAGGTYSLQVWVRTVGTSTDYEAWQGLGTFTITGPAPVQVTSFSANAAAPYTIGNSVTWTATATGGSGTLEYQFWRYKQATGSWTMVRAYASSNTFTWQPTSGDAGVYSLQVWVRSVGSSASYDAFAATDYFTVQTNTPGTPTLVASPALPVQAGTLVTWTAQSVGGRSPTQYKFWLYSQATGTWTVTQDWSASRQWAWRPLRAGGYVVQVWVRSAGSTADYESWFGSDLLQVTAAPVTMIALTPSTAFPIAPGTNVTWQATGAGGATPLEYKFWRWFGGSWSVLRDYAALPTADLTMSAGAHMLQVWAREQGSTADYQSWIGTGTFNVAASTPSITAFTSNQTFPLPADTPIRWTVQAVGGSAPLQYQFWRYSAATGTWTIVQPWSASPILNWTPTPALAGTYRLQVWVRSTGASSYEAWAPFDEFAIVP